MLDAFICRLKQPQQLKQRNDKHDPPSKSIQSLCFSDYSHGEGVENLDVARIGPARTNKNKLSKRLIQFFYCTYAEGIRMIRCDVGANRCFAGDSWMLEGVRWCVVAAASLHSVRVGTGKLIYHYILSRDEEDRSIRKQKRRWNASPNASFEGLPGV
jgi:hypothetical protein